MDEKTICGNIAEKEKMISLSSKNTKILLVLLMIFSLHACDVLQQAQQMYTLSKCDFRLSTIENIRLSGVNVQNKDQFSDLSLSDITQLTMAFVNKEMPLDFRLNIETKNPNQQTAALNKLDWILFIDDIEMTKGTTNQRIEIPPNGGINDLPLNINVDLFNVLSGESKDAIINFGLNLAGQGNQPTRVKVKAKPTVIVAGRSIDYPGYITINNEFGGGSSGSGSGSGSKGSSRIKL
ncbi:MAG: hypothetical protein K9G58_00045 [Bacteroidales bacterium]|nr:hypothetical protein [Bacteroidales bacterium]MCF8396530.1 hypothetical protein [Bacteroidales bacterium]